MNKPPLPICQASSPPVFGWDKPWLAPLAGYTDLPFRLLCRSCGASVCVTEMISAKGLFYKNSHTDALLATVPEDQPLVAQLFGAEPEIMAHAALVLRKSGYFWLDCNLGCSVRKVVRQGAGAALLNDPDKIIAIARAMIAVANLEDGNPKGMTGFKLRLGVSREKPVLPDLALRLEDAGASWLTLHPRYAKDAFSGSADWETLAKLAPRLSIPLLASGDLLCAADGIRCLKQTGVSGLMYARGALRQPDIFRQHLALLNGQPELEASKEDLLALIQKHASLSLKYGGRKGLVKMRSLVPRYVHNFPGVGELRKKLCLCQDWEEFSRILKNFFSQEKNSFII